MSRETRCRGGAPIAPTSRGCAYRPAGLAPASTGYDTSGVVRVARIATAALSLVAAVSWRHAMAVPGEGAPAAPSPTSLRAEVLLRLGWGEGPGRVGVREVPGGRFGPQALAVDEDRQRIYVLDSANERVLTFNFAGRAIGEVRVPAFAEDVAALPGERLAVFIPAVSALECLTHNGSPCGRVEVPRRPSPARGLHPLGNGEVVLWHADNEAFRVSWEERGNGLIADAFAAGAAAAPGEATRVIEVLREPNGRATVRRLDGGVLAMHADLPRRCGTVETVTPVGVDDSGRVVLAVEELCSGAVARFVHVLSEQGAPVASARVPAPVYAFVYRDLVLGRGGAVYQLLVEVEGVSVVRWCERPVHEESADITARPVPLAFFDECERHTVDAAAGEEIAAAQTAEAGTVTQAEAMSRALAYATHVYTVASTNLTPVAGATCGGKLVKTPAWLSSSGTMVGLPYKWGGFTGLEGFSATSVDPDCAGTNTHFFDAGLADGQYAGDYCASSCSGMYCGSHCAVGVDCSGYVSRVWGLPGHVTTSALAGSPYVCPAALPSFDNLLPGDVLNNAGSHMRLFTARSASGAIEVLEASGRDWKVAPHAYQIAELAAYLPYRKRALAGVFASGERVVAADTAPVRSCADLTSPSCTVVGQAARGQAGTLTGDAEEHGGYLVWPVLWDGGPSGWVAQCVLGKFAAGASLSVQLDAEPAVGQAPLAVTLSATVTGTATGAVDLALWWDCPHDGTDVNAVAALCGALPAPAAGTCSAPGDAGVRCSGVWDVARAFTHVYKGEGEFTAKAIVSRGGLVAESRTVVSVRPACSTTLVPERAKVGASGGGVRFEVFAPAGCAWSAESSADWIHVAPASGSGYAAVDVVVEANGSTASRTTIVEVGGRQFTVEQAGRRPPRRFLPRLR